MVHADRGRTLQIFRGGNIGRILSGNRHRMVFERETGRWMDGEMNGDLIFFYMSVDHMSGSVTKPAIKNALNTHKYKHT